MASDGGDDELLSRLQGLFGDYATRSQRLSFIAKFFASIDHITSNEDVEVELKKFRLLDSNENLVGHIPQPPPPPPLPPPSSFAPPAPPPPPPPAPPAPTSTLLSPPPPPPPPICVPQPRPSAANRTAQPNPQQSRCPPSMFPPREKTTKTKTVLWSKISENTVSEDSVWGKMAHAKQLEINLDLLDSFFGIEPAASQTRDVSKKTSPKREDVVELLTPKKSQNVAIMMKQFKNIDNFLESVRSNNPIAELDALHSLHNMLPQMDEEEALKRFSGDSSTLSQPSQFLRRLTAIPHYRLRIECALFDGDFERTALELAKGAEALASGGRQLSSSTGVPKLLHLLVVIGNYLNAHNPRGNACGFTLNSLWKLLDVKTNSHEFSLLHVLTMYDAALIGTLEQELSLLSSASEVSFEELKNSLRGIREQQTKLARHLGLVSDERFVDVRNFVVGVCGERLAQFDAVFASLDELQRRLAEYFCERPDTFKVDECFKIFSFFLVRLRKAHKENIEREARKNRKQKKPDVDGTTENDDVVRQKENEKIDLFDTLQSRPSALTPRKRVDEWSGGVRSQIGAIRIRKVRDVVATHSEPPTPASRAESTSSPAERCLTSTTYERCADLESYISSFTGNKCDQKDKKLKLHQIEVVKAEEVKNAVIVENKEEKRVAESKKTDQAIQKPHAGSPPAAAASTPNADAKTSTTPKQTPRKELPKLVAPISTKPRLVVKPTQIPSTSTATAAKTNIPLPRTAPEKTSEKKTEEKKERKIQPPTTSTRFDRKDDARRSFVQTARRATVAAPTNEHKREVCVKPVVSTSARPSLIKTGTSSGRPSLPKLNALEAPKPLRCASAPKRPPVTPKGAPPRPKWV